MPEIANGDKPEGRGVSALPAFVLCGKKSGRYRGHLFRRFRFALAAMCLRRDVYSNDDDG